MLRQSEPVVIGGVGGSGTRVVAQILSALGFYMGSDLNSAGDNLWFTLLFKRPRWYQKACKDKSMIFTGLSFLSNAMLRSRPPSLAELKFVLRAATVMAFTGHNPSGAGNGLWPLARAWKMLIPREGIQSEYCGWGWKEPNSHIYLEPLAEFFEHFKYIHTIRHGIDMAFSKNQQQVYNWGPIYGVEKPESKKNVPKASLKFWVEANQRVVEIEKRLGSEKLLTVNFDKLCMSPESEIQAILSFLKIHPDAATYERLCKIPKVPKSIGRYLNQDINQFDEDSIKAVRSFGFSVKASGQ